MKKERESESKNERSFDLPLPRSKQVKPLERELPAAENRANVATESKSRKTSARLLVKRLRNASEAAVASKPVAVAEEPVVVRSTAAVLPSKAAINKSKKVEGSSEKPKSVAFDSSRPSNARDASSPAPVAEKTIEKKGARPRNVLSGNETKEGNKPLNVSEVVVASESVAVPVSAEPTAAVLSLKADAHSSSFSSSSSPSPSPSPLSNLAPPADTKKELYIKKDLIGFEFKVIKSANSSLTTDGTLSITGAGEGKLQTLEQGEVYQGEKVWRDGNRAVIKQAPLGGVSFQPPPKKLTTEQKRETAYAMAMVFLKDHKDGETIKIAIDNTQGKPLSKEAKEMAGMVHAALLALSPESAQHINNSCLSPDDQPSVRYFKKEQTSQKVTRTDNVNDATHFDVRDKGFLGLREDTGFHGLARKILGKEKNEAKMMSYIGMKKELDDLRQQKKPAIESQLQPKSPTLNK